MSHRANRETSSRDLLFKKKYKETQKEIWEPCLIGGESISLPVKMFSLEDLSTIFNIDVWEQKFSQEEREYLMTFIPDITDLPPRTRPNAFIKYQNPNELNIHSDHRLPSGRGVEEKGDEFYEEEVIEEQSGDLSSLSSEQTSLFDSDQLMHNIQLRPPSPPPSFLKSSHNRETSKREEESESRDKQNDREKYKLEAIKRKESRTKDKKWIIGKLFQGEIFNFNNPVNKLFQELDSGILHFQVARIHVLSLDLEKRIYLKYLRQYQQTFYKKVMKYREKIGIGVSLGTKYRYLICKYWNRFLIPESGGSGAIGGLFCCFTCFNNCGCSTTCNLCSCCSCSCSLPCSSCPNCPCLSSSPTSMPSSFCQCISSGLASSISSTSWSSWNSPSFPSSPPTTLSLPPPSPPIPHIPTSSHSSTTPTSAPSFLFDSDEKRPISKKKLNSSKVSPALRQYFYQNDPRFIQTNNNPPQSPSGQHKNNNDDDGHSDHHQPQTNSLALNYREKLPQSVQLSKGPEFTFESNVNYYSHALSLLSSLPHPPKLTDNEFMNNYFERMFESNTKNNNNSIPTTSTPTTTTTATLTFTPTETSNVIETSFNPNVITLNAVADTQNTDITQLSKESDPIQLPCKGSTSVDQLQLMGFENHLNVNSNKHNSLTTNSNSLPPPSFFSSQSNDDYFNVLNECNQTEFNENDISIDQERDSTLSITPSTPPQTSSNSVTKLKQKSQRKIITQSIFPDPIYFLFSDDSSSSSLSSSDSSPSLSSSSDSSDSSETDSCEDEGVDEFIQKPYRPRTQKPKKETEGEENEVFDQENEELDDEDEEVIKRYRQVTIMQHRRRRRRRRRRKDILSNSNPNEMDDRNENSIGSSGNQQSTPTTTATSSNSSLKRKRRKKPDGSNDDSKKRKSNEEGMDERDDERDTENNISNDNGNESNINHNGEKDELSKTPKKKSKSKSSSNNNENGENEDENEKEENDDEQEQEEEPKLTQEELKKRARQNAITKKEQEQKLSEKLKSIDVFPLFKELRNIFFTLSPSLSPYLACFLPPPPQQPPPSTEGDSNDPPPTSTPPQAPPPIPPLPPSGTLPHSEPLSIDEILTVLTKQTRILNTFLPPHTPEQFLLQAFKFLASPPKITISNFHQPTYPITNVNLNQNDSGISDSHVEPVSPSITTPTETNSRRRQGVVTSSGRVSRASTRRYSMEKDGNENSSSISHSSSSFSVKEKDGNTTTSVEFNYPIVQENHSKKWIWIAGYCADEHLQALEQLFFFGVSRNQLESLKRLPRCTITIPESDLEKREEFRQQEVERYQQPEKPFRYHHNNHYSALVSPVKRLSGNISNKPREHSSLKGSRPSYVNLLSLVRDAASRLPAGVGTRPDVSLLLKDSQFILEEVSDQQLNHVVSGGLDRLHAEKDPCVRYDPDQKLWIYLHRCRTEEDYQL